MKTVYSVRGLMDLEEELTVEENNFLYAIDEQFKTIEEARACRLAAAKEFNKKFNKSYKTNDLLGIDILTYNATERESEEEYQEEIKERLFAALDELYLIIAEPIRPVDKETWKEETWERVLAKSDKEIEAVIEQTIGIARVGK